MWTHVSTWASLNSVDDVLPLVSGRETLRTFIWDSRSGFRKWFDSPDTWMKLVQFGYSCVADFRFNTWNGFSRLSQQVIATEILTQDIHLHTRKPELNLYYFAQCIHWGNKIRSSGHCNTFHYSIFGTFALRSCFDVSVLLLACHNSRTAGRIPDTL